jgi:hypothetical protein
MIQCVIALLEDLYKKLESECSSNDLEEHLPYGSNHTKILINNGTFGSPPFKRELVLAYVGTDFIDSMILK